MSALYNFLPGLSIRFFPSDGMYINQHLFVLFFDEELVQCSMSVFLTKYTKTDGHAGHPKIVSLDVKKIK